MSELVAKRPWGAWAFWLSVIVGGLACHGIIMATNFLQGAASGVDHESQAINGLGALAVDLIGVAGGSAVAGALWRNYHRVWSVCMGVIVVVCAAYSLSMFYDYNAAKRLEPTRAATQAYDNQITADAKAEIESREAREKLFQAMQAEVTRLGDVIRNRKTSDSDRAQAVTQQNALFSQMGNFTEISVKAAPVEKVMDAGSTKMAQHIGLDVASIQEIRGLVFGAIMLLLGSVLIALGSRMLPSLTPVTPLPRRAEPVPEREKVVRDLSLRLVANNVSRMVAADNQVRQFFQEGTSASPGKEVESHDMHAAYEAWAKGLGYGPILNFRGFQIQAGKVAAAGEAIIQRRTVKGITVYLDRAPVNTSWRRWVA